MSGSEREIREWQKRFDVQRDIDLLEEPELYDINIIACILKAWLRELPTEIFPKRTQDQITAAYGNSVTVPQEFKNALSRLPPWNYYLLFAITCHLSLLASHSNTNRMTFKNLCICFQPALKIDPVCFSWLVQQWKHCWQGCWYEGDYLKQEYRILDNMPPASDSDDSDSGSDRASDAGSASSKSTIRPIKRKPVAGPNTTTPFARMNQGRPAALNLTRAGNQAPPSTPAKPRDYYGRSMATTRLPELEPVGPLSPLMSGY